MKPKRSISTESTRTFSNIHAAQGKAVHALTCAYLAFNSCSRGELSTLAQVIPWPFSHYCYLICPVKPRFAVTLPLHYKVVYSTSLHYRFWIISLSTLGNRCPLAKTYSLSTLPSDNQPQHISPSISPNTSSTPTVTVPRSTTCRYE